MAKIQQVDFQIGDQVSWKDVPRAQSWLEDEYVPGPFKIAELRALLNICPGCKRTLEEGHDQDCQRRSPQEIHGVSHFVCVSTMSGKVLTKGKGIEEPATFHPT